MIDCVSSTKLKMKECRNEKQVNDITTEQNYRSFVG